MQNQVIFQPSINNAAYMLQTIIPTVTAFTHRVNKRERTMILMWLYIVFHLSSSVVHCQHLEWDGTEISNNSVIYYGNISNGPTALKCFTDNNNCCSPKTGNWINQTGQIANQEPYEDRCLYFTRGDHVISLNRLWVCIPPLVGLWRCDVPDSSGVIQSLFIYIGSSLTSG